MGSQINKLEQAFSDGHKMSLTWGGTGGRAGGEGSMSDVLIPGGGGPVQ